MNDDEDEEIACPVFLNDTGRFAVARFDFDYVSIPLIVALWVLFVSVAKIGQFITLTLIYVCSHSLTQTVRFLLLETTTK